MADEGETIEQRHKREQKELQAKIQGLKHSVSKGDKKRKKQVTAEIAQLQAELDQRHEKELAEHKEEGTQVEENELCEEAQGLELNENTSAPKKMSKAQKRREKKEQEERERQQRLVEGEKESLSHIRNIEASRFASILQENKLKILEVRPDGNCMFNSVLLQKSGSANEVGLSDIRKQISQYMLKHQDDFLPFTSNPTTGDMLNEDEYSKYCNDIQTTNAWGGHLELRAISQLYQQRIEVYQATSSTLVIGEEFKGDPIRLSYHRHQYGLGEHYNALVPDKTSSM